MTRDEFCARFKAEMLRIGGPTFSDGESIADYADEIALTYWNNPDQRAEGPEDCASADIQECFET